MASEDHYEDYDWAELPSDVQEAAKVLGYTQKLWDGDEDTPAWEKDYCDLTAAEKSAAKVLGYNEDSWNEDDDDE